MVSGLKRHLKTSMNASTRSLLYSLTGNLSRRPQAVTANHYILDAMAGLVVSLMGLLIAMALQRWGYARVRLLAGQLRGPPAGEPGGPR